jgi:CheY-like chemotaxis protein
LTELHGGSVQARSDGLRQGSQFTVHLPVIQPALVEPTSPGASMVTRAVRRKVLIADDNHDAAEALSLVLEIAGHDVRVANSGEAALALADLFRPDTLVLDIGMPDLTGYQVAQRLRQQAWAQASQLIALTGWGQDRDRRLALESGFDDHLTKPVESDVLLALIQRSEAAPR